MSIYYTLGGCYLLVNQMDSTHTYYTKALEFARLYKDTVNISLVNESFGFFYQKSGDLKTAKQHLQTSVALSKHPSSRMYLNLAKLYEKEANKDSVIYYTSIALQLAEK